MEILDAIDRPMKPLVVALNLAGLKTKWSCCGFPYKGEEEQEKKSHANYPFIVLRPLDLNNGLSVWNFFQMSVIVGAHGWILTPYFGSGEWHLRFEGAADQAFYRNDPNGIHNYETKLLRIRSLTKDLELRLRKDPIQEVKVVDGNEGYEALTLGEWQVKPHEPSLLQSKPVTVTENL